MQTVDVRIGKAIVNPMNSFLPKKDLYVHNLTKERVTQGKIKTLRNALLQNKTNWRSIILHTPLKNQLSNRFSMVMRRTHKSVICEFKRIITAFVNE